jgi:hypothetical protein
VEVEGKFGAEGEPAKNVSYRAKVTAPASEAQIRELMRQTGRVAEIHSGYMVHAATTNQNPHGRMRLSTGIHYQRRRDEIDARWQNHWSFDDML